MTFDDVPQNINYESNNECGEKEYVCDMGVSYISEMTKLYKTAMKFNYSVVNGDVESIPPLVFPYIKIIKRDIIDNLDLQLYDIFGDTSFYTIIPTCQEITVRFIKLAFNKNKYWLYISLENCGNCKYCKTYNSSLFLFHIVYTSY